MANAGNPGKPPRRRFRKLVFALVLNLALLGLAEALARIFGPPYYVLVAREAGLARAKAPGEKRVFLYGESTIYGWPYGPRNSTACWLDQILKAVLPGENVRTVNFGRPGRGTPHLRDALENTLAHQPDVVVLCIGHNEFLPWTHQFVEGPLHHWTYFHSHLYRTAHEAHLRLRRRRDAATYAYAGFPPEALTHERVLVNYHRQMEAMLTTTRDHGVAALLCVPGCNLAEQPPQLADQAAPVDTEAARKVQYYLKEIQDALVRGGMSPALLEQALTTAAEAVSGNRAAEAHYLRGRALDLLGRSEGAYAAYSQARDLDHFPNRCKSAQIATLQALAGQFAVPLVDLPAAFRQAAGQRAPGLRWFVDNCHPRAEGQFLMAEALARALCAAGWLAPPERWRWEKLPTFAECAAALLTPEEWRDYDRTALLSLLESDPVRVIDLARYPPALAADLDPEWTALHALALWRCAFRAEAGLAWDRLDGPRQAAAHAAAKSWPPTVQQWWAEMQTLRTASK